MIFLRKKVRFVSFGKEKKRGEFFEKNIEADEVRFFFRETVR